MLKLTRHKTFIKDLNKVKLSDKHYSKYITYLSKLLNQESLPAEALDHPLNGEWKDTREFHVSGDVLVVYMLTDEALILLRIGSHSQIFK
jgi:mRNA interferase YafQ